MEECQDDERDWYPQRIVCWPTAQLRAAEALYEQRHEDAQFHDGSFLRWSKERSRDFPFHYSDGVAFYLSQTEDNPDDEWLGDEPGAEQAEADPP